MRDNSLLRLWMLLVLFFALGAHPVSAQDRTHKAERGITNILTGWLEIPKQIHNGGKSYGGPAGLFGGFFRGLALGFLRTGVGAFEVVTFPFEYPEHYASPYESMELSDYAWEH